MKWGRKKPSLNSSSSSKSSPFSSRVPFLSHVLPSSWLSKFKRGVDTQPKASSCERCGLEAVKKTMEAERIGRFGNGIAWDVKKMEEFRRDAEILPGEKATMIKTPRVMPQR